MHYSQDFTLIDKKGQRKYLNESERTDFIKAVKLLSNERRLFLMMIFWTGIRMGEALSILPEHIDMYDESVTIKSLKKRGKVRYRKIPLPSFYLDELEELVCKKKMGEPIWAFSKRSGVRYVKMVMDKAKLYGTKACSRGLRHSFAVACILNQVPLPLIQRYMGHASITVTVIYTQIIGADERKLVSRIWTV